MTKKNSFMHDSLFSIEPTRYLDFVELTSSLTGDTNYYVLHNKEIGTAFEMELLESRTKIIIRA